MPFNATLNSIQASDKGGYIVKYTKKGESSPKQSIVTNDVLESVEGLEEQLIASMHKLGELGDQKPIVALSFTKNSKGFYAVSSIGAEDPKLDEQQSKFGGGGRSFGGGGKGDTAGMKAGGIMKVLAGLITADTSQEDILTIGRKLLAVQNQLEKDIKEGKTKEVSGTTSTPKVTATPKVTPAVNVQKAVGGDTVHEGAPF